MNNLNHKILKAILKGLYEGLSKYDLTMLDNEDSVLVKNDLYKHSSIYDDLIERLLEFLDNNKAFKNIVEKIILLNKQYKVLNKEELKLLIDKTVEIFGNECDLNWIDTSLITDMSKLFYDMRIFNGHIENWNVSNVKDMNSMFYYAEVFNQDISSWNVSNVKDMSMLFCDTKCFNLPIGNWDVSNVKDMYGMFYYAESFNQPLNNWNVSNVTNMYSMFYAVKSFNQDISNWNVSNVEDKQYIFVKCPIKKEYKPKFK